MTRTAAREIAIQLGFSAVGGDYEPEQAVEEFFEPEHYASLAAESELYRSEPGEQLAFIRQSVCGVVECRLELDGYIAQYAKGWRTERIDKAAAAILRQAMYEILYMPDVPNASSIDEAVELAKTYEGQDVAGFINGILAAFIRSEHHE